MDSSWNCSLEEEEALIDHRRITHRQTIIRGTTGRGGRVPREDTAHAVPTFISWLCAWRTMWRKGRKHFFCKSVEEGGSCGGRTEMAKTQWAQDERTRGREQAVGSPSRRRGPLLRNVQKRRKSPFSLTSRRRRWEPLTVRG